MGNKQIDASPTRIYILEEIPREIKTERILDHSFEQVAYSKLFEIQNPGRSRNEGFILVFFPR